MIKSFGRLMATGGQDRIVRLWDAGTGKEKEAFHGHERGIVSVAFSPDGKRLASSAPEDGLRFRAPPRLGDRVLELGCAVFASSGGKNSW